MIDVAIRKRLGSFQLEAVFEAPPGVTALFGPSGSGKTSLVRAIAGLIEPDDGHIKVAGRTLWARQGAKVPVRDRKVGYVFQDARLFPHMSVARNLRYGGAHDADRVIDLLGLRPHLERSPRHLSGGEAQRVALGRALMARPDILLLDEPLASLDGARKAEVLPYLEALRDRKDLAIVYVSHSVAEVARLADTLVLLEDGRVTRAGPVADVLADPVSVPLLGVREAGAVIAARVREYHAADGLSTLTFGGGTLVLPGKIGRLGEMVRLRVPAQDVILSRDAPTAISALNVLPVTVVEIAEGRGPGVAVALAAGPDRLLARITRRSAGRLGLAVGQSVYAIFNATAVAPDDIGTALTARESVT